MRTPYDQRNKEVMRDLFAPAGCVRKHLVWRQVLTLRSAPVLIPEGITPWMWVISAGVSEEALRQFGFQRDVQREGLYALPPAFTVGLVAVSQLPRIRETLLLRLMGAGRTLRMAMEDLTALPPNALEARIVVPHLLRLKLLLVTSTEPEDQEFTMETEDIFSKLVRERAEDYERGLQKGLQVAEHLLVRRLGRPLGAIEREALLTKVGRVGPDRLVDVVLDMAPEQLPAWLADPAAG